MAFGVLFDFTGNSNASKIIKAAQMVNQTWFTDAVNYSEPIDLFLVIGHNPVRTTVSASTFAPVLSAIRKLKPDTPIQVFGGHTHIRDFVVYDNKATGLEAGKFSHSFFHYQLCLLYEVIRVASLLPAIGKWRSANNLISRSLLRDFGLAVDIWL